MKFIIIHLFYIVLYKKERMGAIRSMPENEVATISDNNKNLYFVNASVCGWQYLM
jgi:hypothetical protein